jgi:hypothetical protein
MTGRRPHSLRWIDWCVLAEVSADLLTRPRFPWLRDHARHAYLSPWSRRWWWFAWWLWLAGPAFRLAIRLGVWEVQEGELYVRGDISVPRWMRRTS